MLLMLPCLLCLLRHALCALRVISANVSSNDFSRLVVVGTLRVPSLCLFAIVSV